MNLEPADKRRAAALVAHHTRRNHEGMKAVFDEAIEVGRPNYLLLAVLDLYGQLLPELRTPEGQQLLGDLALIQAAAETDE